MIDIQNYIGGKHVAAADGSTLPVINPATGKSYATAPASTSADVNAAVSAAAEQKDWIAFTGEERAAVLNRIADGIDRRLEKLARAESEDNGKPIHVARSIDIPRAARNFRFFAGAAAQFGSESHGNAGASINYTLRQPLGVVGCISPWNLPLYLFTWKVAPALAAGNTVVAKPSEVTPMTAYVLGEICEEAGVPAGALNIVHGTGISVGSSMCEHPDIKAISFTGSTRTGRAIAATAAPLFKKLSLEMGGKNPVLIFADCDFDKMLDTTVRSSFSNQGEICLCGSRIYVEASIFDQFRDAFLRRTKALQVGDPSNDASDLGAIVSVEHLNKIESYVGLAREDGGEILTGGRRADVGGRFSDGYFFEPTIIAGLDNSCRANQEEIFGPVVTIAPFQSEAEALQLANDSAYGLASVVWTNNLARSHRLAEQLRTGIVWVNCWMNRDLRTPFGGVRSSGVGREGGNEVMRFFTEPKNVCIDYSET